MFCETCLPAVMAGTAMVMDLCSARVDNRWILFCIGLGLTVRIYSGGPGGLVDALIGALLPILLLGVLFILRMLGAGDIKLLCAIGSILGREKILKCMAFSIFIGACISLAILISTGSICQRFLYFTRYFSDLADSKERKPYYRNRMSAPENFHFTVPVFLSAALYAGGAY